MVPSAFSLDPADRVDCPKVSILDLAQLLIAIVCDTPNDPSFVLTAACHEISCGVEIKGPDCRAMTSHRELAYPLINRVIEVPCHQCVIIAC